MNNKKKLYKMPQATDLSGLGATGDDPMGFCTPGGLPSTSACRNGDAPTQDPEACSPSGTLPDMAKCLVGGAVAHGCLTGSVPVNA